MSRRQLSSLSIAPATLAALTRAGYETLEDLSTTSRDALASDLKLPPADAALLFAHAHTPSVSASALPRTQSAAALQAAPARRFSTRCKPVDDLLGGGLVRGQILEVSGPPGTMKESVAVGVVQSFVQQGEENMISPNALDRALQSEFPQPNLQRRLTTNPDTTPKPADYRSLVHHLAVPTLPELMIFIHTLPAYLDAHPNTALLVLSAVAFPFQTPNLAPGTRAALLERVKTALARACAARSLTVVATSQLATKVLNADGSAGTFDTGATAVMVPQLGPGYLPSGRAHRVIIHPETRMSGVVRLLSSPTYQPGRGAAPQQPYIVVDGTMQLDER
ncbi:hypothetical protein HWV62_9699 [Athelia sp. TMB]|nr:hypothetical protein HWV62_9699 [Athelia sp. TMB]